ncbi:MAG: DNA helicase RecQ [Burkholderiaceae bacterium]
METDAPSLKDPQQVLQHVFGYEHFRGEQESIVDHVASGGDALVLMPTGGGKSLCYQIPSLVRAGTGVVVSPLIALMQDQVAALEALGVRAAFLNSTLGGAQAAAIEREMRAGALDMLYVAPERLLTPRCQDLLAASTVALFAIDEAHCVSQWGHDFRPEYAQLSVLHERFPEVPRIALTATADEATREEIVRALDLGQARVFVSSFDRPNIRYRIVEKDEPRRQLLSFIRDAHAGEAGIVYCLSRAKVEQTAEFLVEQGIEALPYHAGMGNETRARHQQRFLREEGIVMVATIAFGMGIDKPDVRFVAHLDLPKSVEGYYQETGRAGRDGEPAEAWMTYGLADVVQQRRMIDESEADEAYKRVVGAKLDAMLGLCETVECRRARLLAYFGEQRPAGWRCGNCDTCLDPPQTFDGTVAVQKLLSTVYRTGQRFGAQHLIDVLRGKESEKVSRFGHERLSVFGVGQDHDDRGWRSIIRQCVAAGMLSVDHAGFGALKLAGDAREVLRGERAIALRRIAPKASRSRRARASGTPEMAPASPAESTRFEALRAWRLATARERGVPPYVIFQDRTLHEIARAAPESVDELRGITGIGDRKLENWGEALLAAIADADGSSATAADD